MLIRVQEAKGDGSRGETEGREPLKYFGDSFKKDKNAKGSMGEVVWFAWFVKDDTIGSLPGLRVISMEQEGIEERWKEPFIGLIDSLPDRVEDTTRTRGRSV